MLAFSSESSLERGRSLGFTREQLEACRDTEVDDLVDEAGTAPRLVVVGINPGLWTAATGTHFAHPSNRFYKAVHRAGITDRELDPRAGLAAEDRAHLLARGLAITNLVRRATARASEVSDQELRAGALTLVGRLERWRPQVVAVTGVSAYRTAFGHPRARPGAQERRLAGAELWVVPNPSGLNAHETVASLAAWYRRVADAAGLISPVRSATVPRPHERGGS